MRFFFSSSFSRVETGGFRVCFGSSYMSAFEYEYISLDGYIDVDR